MTIRRRVLSAPLTSPALAGSTDRGHLVNTPFPLIIDAANTSAFVVFGAPTTWGEVAGFASGALCVGLVARMNIWNWPIGIANNVFFLLLFFSAGLYADGGLQLVFIMLALYGWWAWLRGGTARSELPASRTAGRQWAMLMGAGIVGTAAMTWFLSAHTDSTVPLADAFTTVLSLLATWGQTRKKVESWWLWILADLIYVPLYVHKGLTLTALLYVGFLALCIVGLMRWTRELRTGASTRGAPPAAVEAMA
jgi:nicotinamide mononucleotide transporter